MQNISVWTYQNPGGYFLLSFKQYSYNDAYKMSRGIECIRNICNNNKNDIKLFILGDSPTQHRTRRSNEMLLKCNDKSIVVQCEGCKSYSVIIFLSLSQKNAITKITKHLFWMLIWIALPFDSSDFFFPSFQLQNTS